MVSNALGMHAVTDRNVNARLLTIVPSSQHIAPNSRFDLAPTQVYKNGQRFQEMGTSEGEQTSILSLGPC